MVLSNKNLWHPFAYGHAERPGDTHNTMVSIEHSPMRTHYLSLVHKSYSVRPLRLPTTVTLFLLKLGAYGKQLLYKVISLLLQKAIYSPLLFKLNRGS